MSKFYPFGGKTYSLQSSINSTQTSITLSSFTVPVSGDNITMALMNTDVAYGTIAPRTSQAEFISFTGITQNADGTATLTGVTRGLNKAYPYTEDSDFKLPHSGGSQFILSDAPQLFNKYSVIENDEQITGEKTFTLLPRSDGGNATDGDQLVTYAQALAMATGTASINRVVVAGTAGTTIVVGATVYLDSATNKWQLTDADTANTVNNVIKGIAQGAGTNNNPITSGVLLFGLDSNQSGKTPGAVQYFSNTAGAMSETPGTIEVTAGQAISATEVLFFPSFNQQLTEDQQDALAGTAGTPSATNKYVTNDDTSGTGSIVRSSLVTTKFGGTGADGVLNITSGTTTVDLGGSLVKVLNYTTIDIAVGATLAFTNAHTNGSIVLLKSTGNQNILGTISTVGMGAAGQATAGSGGPSGSGTNASTSLAIYGNPNTAGGGWTGGSSTGGVKPTNLAYYGVDYRATMSANERFPLFIFPGAGGGAGGNGFGGGGNGGGGAGGNGGGGLYIECGGAWNFTGTINTSGSNGAQGVNASVLVGGGGGGGAGAFLALYNTLTANSGTVTASGGTGGNSSSGTIGGATAGGGAGGASMSTDGSAGTTTTSNNTKVGGDGASISTNYEAVYKNNVFY